MATRTWRGDAPAVAQVTTFTVTADDATTTYSITINGKKVSALGSGTGTTATATALAAALAASTIPEFLEVTWTSNTAVVTGTALTAGVPFTATSSVSGGTGTIGAASTTVGSGPNDLSLAANWTGLTLPVNGDDIVFDNGSVSAWYGLTALSAVTPNSVTINANYTGQIGLNDYNGAYYEYRQAYLQLAGVTTTCNIGNGPGQGSGRIKIDFGSTAAVINVANTASPTDGNGRQSVIVKGTSASNALNVTKGVVGVATLPGETANLSGGLTVGFVSNPAGDATVICGTGVTLATVTQSGGSLTTQSAITTLTQIGGTLYQLAGAITTQTIGGTVYSQVSGAIGTTVNVLGGGTLDLSRDMRAKSWTTLNLYKGATHNDPFNTGANNPFKTIECTLNDVTVNIGINKVYTPS